MNNKYDILIIGGGFYGLYIAEYLAIKGFKILLCEKNTELMQQASFSNQARVHNGYHYPRSILTALRSHASFPRFIDEFKDAIVQDFDNYYMIGKTLGNITAKQFTSFCNRIGSPYKRAPEKIHKLTNPKLIEDTFLTTECVFDAGALKEIMINRLSNLNVTILTNTTVESVKPYKNTLLANITNINGKNEEINIKRVFNCTYSSINLLNKNSNLETIPLKHEMTEICITDVPDEIKKCAFTVMCGPFFSIMPFPSTTQHSFSHVRYTPHYEWTDTNNSQIINPYKHIENMKKKSAWTKIIKDASRYIPILKDCEYKRSLWQIKTTLPSSELNDSRPILFKQDYVMKNYHCILGGKIDNVYDAIRIISAKGLDT